tara:strand:- start:2737 stop:3504 length:768 start_codon:yes stop_codon:yes gene_type:complete
MPFEKKILIKNDYVTFGKKKYHIGSKKAFEILSKIWLRSGWDTKYVYSFSWMGRPIIQLPDDLIRIQEIIYDVKPNVIIETGIAHGGGLIFYASLLSNFKKNFKIIGVDIDIRKHNKKAIKSHFLFKNIFMYEGSSIDLDIYKKVKKNIKSKDKVLVVLDSNHSTDHVLKELELYSRLVSKNSYIVACDGIQKDMKNAARSKPDWNSNNPLTAIKKFIRQNKNFKIMKNNIYFNESKLNENYVTYWPNAYLKKLR